MREILGYAASSAVLASFLMRSMVPLRLVAILGNILFLTYGYFAQIHPVFFLHASLLPINVARLVTYGNPSLLDRVSRNRHFVLATDRARHALLFILGSRRVRWDFACSSTSHSPLSINAAGVSLDRHDRAES
jgi:hypothetical protein